LQPKRPFYEIAHVPAKNTKELKTRQRLRSEIDFWISSDKLALKMFWKQFTF